MKHVRIISGKLNLFLSLKHFLRVIVLIRVMAVVLAVMGVAAQADTLSDAWSETCIADLTNKEQVVTRLAFLRIKIEKISPSESDLEFQMESHYHPKVEELSPTFGLSKEEFEEQINKKYLELKNKNQVVESQSEVDKKIIKEQAQQMAQELERQRIGPPIKFHQIAPGSFYMGEEGQKVLTTIEKPFAMMDRPITQRQWTLIMGKNPSNFIEGEHTEEILINGALIKMQPENPVESVNYEEDVPAFIKRVNELSEKDDPLIKILVPGHKKGDIYRLPTGAEKEFVMRDRGASNGIYPEGQDESNLTEYAWFDENAKGTTHPVAQKKPIIVHGPNGEELKFYDLQGNVWEWCQDGDLVVRGGSWNYDARLLRSAYRLFIVASDRYDNVGFRLVRTN